MRKTVVSQSLILLAVVILGPIGRSSTAYAAPLKPKPRGGRLDAPAKGVVALFTEAQRLFNSGKFEEALIAYDRILKKYPSHEPTIIQYAKTLYRLDRIPESYNLFARINPQYLDPETSYEYGYSSYVNQRWDAALFSFKRVPSDHALYDLANYYGALSAIKLKKYAEAEDMLDKAVVLPDKLSRSRTLYQKHVQSLKHLQEKADLEQAATAEKARLNSPKNPPGAAQTGNTIATSKSEAKAYVHKGFLYVDRIAKLEVSKEHQLIDKHGYSQTTFDNEVGSFHLSHGPIWAMPSKRNSENNSAIGLQLDLGIEDRNSKGRQERIVVYEDSRDTPLQQSDVIPATHTNLGTVGGSGWVEIALPESWWLGLTASLNFEYPKFERGQRTSKRVAKPHVGRKFNMGAHKATAFASYSYEQLTDSELEPLIDTSVAEFIGDITFSSDTIVTVKGSSSQFSYHLPTIGGPDDIFSGSLELAQMFPLGIVISARGTVASQKNNIVRGLPSVDAASADGTTLSGRGKFEATPVPWLTVYAKYDMSKTTWTVNEPDREEVYKKNVPDYVDQTTFAASLNFLF